MIQAHKEVNSPEMPRVSVIIPNWNGSEHLPDCLAALEAQSFTDFEVVVVDNNSTDGSVEWVRCHHPRVRVLPRADNGGFSKAVNAGIGVAAGEYVALLNNDTVAEPGWLGALVLALDEHPGYDFAASKMLLFYDPGRLNAAGDVYALARVAGSNRGFGRRDTEFDSMERVLGACAGAALYRKALFDEVGLFDEDFFLMSEDVDFDLRCLIAGRRCLYVPGARVAHKFRASIETLPAGDMSRLAARNEAIVAAKDLPVALLGVAPLVWLYRLFRHTVPVRPSKWHLLPELLRRAPSRSAAEWEGWRLGLKKRPEVWRHKQAGTIEIVRWLLKGWGPV